MQKTSSFQSFKNKNTKFATSCQEETTEQASTTTKATSSTKQNNQSKVDFKEIPQNFCNGCVHMYKIGEVEWGTVC